MINEGNNEFVFFQLIFFWRKSYHFEKVCGVCVVRVSAYDAAHLCDKWY